MPPTVEDSAGHVVGPYIAIGPPILGTAAEGVFLTTSAGSFAVQVNNQGFVGGPVYLYYTTADCSGTAYLPSQEAYAGLLLPFAQIMNGTVYVLEWSATKAITASSVMNGTQCSPLTNSFVNFGTPVTAGVQISSLGFVPPFTVH